MVTYGIGDRVSDLVTGSVGTVVDVASYGTDVEVDWDANEHGGYRSIVRTSAIEFALEI
jgi:hypothetical protein